MAIPTATVAQMREVDRIMIDELHIELLGDPTTCIQSDRVIHLRLPVRR